MAGLRVQLTRNWSGGVRLCQSILCCGKSDGLGCGVGGGLHVLPLSERWGRRGLLVHIQVVGRQGLIVQRCMDV